MPKRHTLIAPTATLALGWIAATPHHAGYVHDDAQGRRSLVLVGDKSRLVISDTLLDEMKGLYQPSRFDETARMFEPLPRLPAPMIAKAPAA